MVFIAVGGICLTTTNVMKNFEMRWWAVLLSTILPVSICATIGAFVPLSDLQMWWHLAFGRAADGFARIPNAIHVSYLVGVNTPSFILPWLSQWWMYKIEAALGLPGLVFARAMITSLGLGVTTFVGLRHTNGWACRLLAVACAVVVGMMGAFTPATFGAAFLAFTVAAIVLSRDRRVAIIVPVLLAPIWVNVDASFVVGAAAMVAAAAARRDRVTLIGAVAFALATLVSPRSYMVWVEAFAQWRAPSYMTIIASFGAIVALGGFAKSDWFTPEDRAVAVASILGAMVFSNPVGVFLVLPAMVRGAPAPKSTSWMALGVVGFAVAVLSQPLWVWHDRLAEPIASTTVSKAIPTQAIDIIGSWGSRPRFYNAPEVAGLLIWQLAPDGFYPVVFQDHRSLGPAFDALRDTVDGSVGVWRGVFQQNGVTAAFLSLPHQQRLAEELASDPAWHVVWESDTYVLLAR